MGLYQKHRPASFDDIIGNEDTIRFLKTKIEKGTLPHTILFHGTRGCGKTTLARVCAKALKCSDVDLCELDAADFRGIDDMRSIRRKVHYRPLEGPVRVWILDECHAITSQGQEAILKALEETPSHVYFFLCTTNPEMLKSTILSRCTQLRVEDLSPSDIGKILVRICNLEGKPLPIEVLKAIAKNSVGSGRDAVVLLETVIDEEKPTTELVERLSVDKIEANKLGQALLKEVTWKDMVEVLKSLKGDPETIRRQILAYMSVVLMNSGKGRAYDVMFAFSKNYFDLGKAGLVMSCWECTK